MCTQWRVELLFVGPDAAVWVREWHGDACPIWTEIDVT